jgi:hypothetical protein
MQVERILWIKIDGGDAASTQFGCHGNSQIGRDGRFPNTAFH